MRIHPMALYLYMKGYSLSDALDVIKRTSKITHAHERAMLGCEIYSLVLWELLKNPSKASVKTALSKADELFSKNPEISHYKRLIHNIGGVNKGENNADNSGASIDEIKSTGYVVYTLEAAMFCLLNTESYEDCVLAAVNLGDDTDTVAAVAGSLAGALYGYEEIPPEWINTLMRLEYIESLCERAYSEFIK
jgi:ADP-ribosylglycohydrolase